MVTDVVLDVADDGALKDPTEQYDVADGERGAATILVFRVELVRKCNRLSCGGAPVGTIFCIDEYINPFS